MKANQRRFIEEDGSILDVVHADARRLGTRMAKTDKDKLDEYLTAVREVERRLQRQAKWIDVPDHVRMTKSYVEPMRCP